MRCTPQPRPWLAKAPVERRWLCTRLGVDSALHRAGGGEDIKVVVGGIIPPADYDFLYASGAVGVFGPGTSIIDSANQSLNALEKKKG